MTAEQKPSIWSGLLVGLLLTAPILALAFLGSVLIDLPLIPLDFFDFIVPLTPGWVITPVIDTMVTLITVAGYGEDVDTVAKTAEQAIGFITVWGLGGIVGAAFYGFGASIKGRETVAGAGVGVLLALVFGAISATSNFLGVSPAVAFIWVAVLYVGFGLALGWTYRDLSAIPTKDETDGDVEGGLDRRDFLVRVGGATATLTVVGAGLGIALGGESEASTDLASAPPGSDPVSSAPEGELPNFDAEVQPAPGMRPEYTPVEDHYRIDIATRPIEIDLETWTLPFIGLVSQETELTMAQLQENYESIDQYITLQCISNRIGGNLISTTKWTGVPVRDVLADLELDENAGWLRIEGGDNFFEYLSIDMVMEDPRIMFAYAWDDQPLPQRNGFPLRVYIPDRYGMKQPKWINNIIVTENDERGYWVRRGWSADATMMTSSVVDTVATNDTYEDDDGTMRVPVGGYAIAGAREISKVEVQINEGEWTEAQLRTPLSDKTWVFWRYDWAFEEGSHRFAVRCYDGNGDLQPTEEQGPRPDGATGIDSATATL